MKTVIEMFREDQYQNWAEAEKMGGVYSAEVHSVDEPLHGAGAYIMDDIMQAIKAAVSMMDGGAAVAFRVVSK